MPSRNTSKPALQTTTTTEGKGFPAYKAVEACLDAPIFLFNGARGIYQSVGFHLDEIPHVRLVDLGYSEKAKMSGLKRMYFNPVEAERVRDLIKRRRHQAFTSASMSMRGGTKDSRSMGYCMEALVISTTADRTTAEVMYRSTEVIKKFSADLAFLPWVFEQLEVKPDSVRFHFANAYLSGVFFPTLFSWWDPVSFLKMIRKRDPKLFIVATRFLRRLVRTPDQRFPYSPENQQHIYAWKHYPEKIPAIRDYLEEYLR